MNTTSFQSEHHHRRRRSRAEVAELVAVFERSGLSQAEYCRRHGLSLASLKRYSKRMATGSRSGMAEAECAVPVVSLIPVEVAEHRGAPKALSTALFVELSGGQRIGVGVGFDAETLRRLIVVLGEV
ncbi:MAG: IS66 family insertion sequence element accessory protein TnpA [Acidobacteriaceae bacterium]